ncbi:MAG: 16S rRNA (guanine(966)-N(2))-methyltransferase RsmD [bacterium]
MRVVAGVARGRRLKSPKRAGVRPTLGRVREALFDILGDEVQGSRVLDLFAGSGALGIEALSRGAAFALFVDGDPACIRAVRENLQACGLLERAAVVRGNIPEDWPQIRQACRESGPPSGAGPGPPHAFDLVFLDPPYGSGMERQALEGLVRFSLLRESARIVCEQGRKRQHACVFPKELGIESERRYGDSILTFLTYGPGAKNEHGECKEA